MLREVAREEDGCRRLGTQISPLSHRRGEKHPSVPRLKSQLPKAGQVERYTRDEDYSSLIVFRYAEIDICLKESKTLASASYNQLELFLLHIAFRHDLGLISIKTSRKQI